MCLRARESGSFSGDLAVDGRQYERAAELYMTALRHVQRVGFRPWVNLVTQRIGVLAIHIGDQRRTVEGHVENTLGRLRLSWRTEVAVWMVEHARG